MTPLSNVSDGELLARRERLTEQFAAGQAELGGILYEMAIRDHVRLDVLIRKAAALQRVDLELAEVEGELRGDVVEVGGHCTACGARHAVSARFCASCGTSLAAGSIPATTTTTSGSTGAATATSGATTTSGTAPMNGATTTTTNGTVHR